jgi:hypothetical protein
LEGELDVKRTTTTVRRSVARSVRLIAVATALLLGLTLALPANAGAATIWRCTDRGTLRSEANGLYVSAELGYSGGNYGQLRARAMSRGPWEEFQLCVNYGGTFSIWSNANARWVSTEVNYPAGNQYMLRARATQIGSWEEYIPAPGPLQGYRVVMQSTWPSAGIVAAELGYSGASYAMLRARASSAGPWEQFTFVPDSGPSFASLYLSRPS